MALRGGKRENAGRKSVIEDNKKVGYKYTYHLDRSRTSKNSLEGSSFSEKCVSLIDAATQFYTEKKTRVLLK